jgi:hypothetical protein
MPKPDESFWGNPPWGDGKQKYRLGLSPISQEEWLNRKIGDSLYKYKKSLLDNKYQEVIAVTESSLEAQNILNEYLEVDKRDYPDLIADMSLVIQDDLCLIKSNGDQELIAASVCSPSYWNVQSKIGKPLREIHEPVTTLNDKIGDRIATFIRQAPIMRPFARQNWLIHGDTKRFYTSEETLPQTDPSDWFIRSEKETLCRFHEDYSLFTINVFFQPLKLVLEHSQQKQNLINSLRGFDDAEISYFGGAKKIHLLLNYLSG